MDIQMVKWLMGRTALDHSLAQRRTNAVLGDHDSYNGSNLKCAFPHFPTMKDDHAMHDIPYLRGLVMAKGKVM